MDMIILYFHILAYHVIQSKIFEKDGYTQVI